MFGFRIKASGFTTEGLGCSAWVCSAAVFMILLLREREACNQAIHPAGLGLGFAP